QFYISCANVRVSGSGMLSPGSTVSFPGAYQQSDPSILINIYGPSSNFCLIKSQAGDELF
ncbi:hypothetical protein LZ32DRAFT_517237, partial [Colletotrichum eremochloae]